MSGSTLLHIVMPIVMTAVLAVWLAMVLYTDAHPPTGKQDTAKPSDDPGEATEPGKGNAMRSLTRTARLLRQLREPAR